jgi:outer membrane receptor protein involved in Fe transport/outer membrane protein OmpA-like peptidoglycan-associated protein
MINQSRTADDVRPIYFQHRQSRRTALLIGGAMALAFACGHAGAEEQATDQPQSAAATNGSGLEEVVVTSTRRAEDIQRVPITVTAYSEAQMDDQGIKQIDDLARLTPDLQFTHTAGSNGANISNISIRGVFSDVGAATTGIYIDDTPIQTRNIGYFSSNAYPAIFDLDRVEVLRGPQGTLFGAGAEGGAVRFLTPQPSLDTYSGYARSEISDTINGDPSYEAGVAVGGPIVEDKLGFRASGWTRNDGGYVDRVSPDTGKVVDANSNYDVSSAGKLAFAWKPTDALTITPSFYYQNIYDHDRDQYWATLSNANADEFKQAARVGQPSRDQFALPALKIQYDFDDFSIISDTSYFAHKRTQQLDYSNYLGGLIYGNTAAFPPGDVPSVVYLDTNQRDVTQEVRVQSTDKDALLTWTAGVFYSWDKKTSQELYGNGQSFFFPVLIDGKFGQREWIHAYDEQVSGYGDITANLADGVKATAGVRVSDTKFNYVYDADGVINGGVSHNLGSQQETPATPKFGLSWQVDPQNFLYASAAEGFRPGGAQQPITVGLCGPDLKTLGETSTPTTYNSDSLWSYELGAKDSLFGGRLLLDSSVYVIKWNSIQQTVRLPICGFSYVANLGAATGVGGDISARLLVTEGLTIGGALGYNDLTFDKTIHEGNSAAGQKIIFAVKGDRIGGPPLNATAWAQYGFQIFGDTDAYSRVDYSFQSHSVSFDPAVFGYDPGIRPAEASSSLSLRVGATFDGWDISAFVNNLTNDETYLTSTHDIPGSRIYYNLSYRPTTAGLTVVYRFSGGSEEPPAPAPYSPPPVVPPAAPVAHSYMVFFDFNKSDLTPEALSIVDQAAHNAGPAKVTEINVTGHTDTVGSDAYNMRLSRRRAEAVAAQLEKDGVPASEIAIFAKGKHDLLVPTKDGVREPQNRRVQIVYAGGPTS